MDLFAKNRVQLDMFAFAGASLFSTPAFNQALPADHGSGHTSLSIMIFCRICRSLTFLLQWPLKGCESILLAGADLGCFLPSGPALLASGLRARLL